MNINYQNATLNIVCDGKIIELFSAPLTEIDNITKCEVSKFTLLRNLLKSDLIDNNSKRLLRDIENNLTDGLLFDDDCKTFDFFLIIKNDNKKIVIPIMYNQYSLDKQNIVKELRESPHLIDVLQIYYKKYEENNIININARKNIEEVQSYIIKNDLSNEFIMFEQLNQDVENGIWLDDKDYNYYKRLKATIYYIRVRDKALSELVSNLLKSSYYKTRSLCMIRKYCDDELSEFSSIILTASDNSYATLEDVLKKYTLEQKKFYYE